MGVLETLRKKAQSLEVTLLLVMEAQLQIGGMYNTFLFGDRGEFFLLRKDFFTLQEKAQFSHVYRLIIVWLS